MLNRENHLATVHMLFYRYLEQKLYDGYFDFKAITYRDWNAGVCGFVVLHLFMEVEMGSVKPALH